MNITPAQLHEMQQLYQMLTAMKAVSGTPDSGSTMHGTGGLLSGASTTNRVINAQVGFEDTLYAQLPWQRSEYEEEIVEVFTGQTANTGSQNTTACGDAKKPGDLKMAKFYLPWARHSMDSRVIQVDKVGRRKNRGDFMDYQMIGNPFANVPAPTAITPDQIIKDEINAEFMRLWVGWHIEYARNPYLANPANTAGNTGYQEYNGLDIQYNTNKTDVSSALVPALDSRVVDATNLEIKDNGGYYFRMMNGEYDYVNSLASALRLGEIEWAWSMPKGAFKDLAQEWACAYHNSGCAGSNASTKDQIDTRDAMLQGKYLLMTGGKRVRVIFDDAQPQTFVGSSARSKIYLHPLRGNLFTDSGGNLTFFQFYDMNLQMPYAQAAAPRDSFQAIAGGRMLLHRKPPTNECVQFRMTGWERLVCRTPFLAVRINNVQYTPYAIERSPFPADSNYVNGGVTVR